MSFYIFLALCNGIIIGTSRTINGRLSAEVGAFRASTWNHVVGFLLLTVILLFMAQWTFTASAPPPSAYLGGFFGAFFVAVNSYVFPRLGAKNTVLLVISGQMISAVLLDYRNQGVPPSGIRWLGVAIIILGVYLSRASNSAREKDKAL
jgi:transporter family-2 protein